ncbi:4-oxalocrotonate tautomerase family enzyme [Desulfitobacterium dichloroeliminans LMG P-21439]|uniref:Tautomerase n=1 Tax=Desulfitobacterium dichloroeliminans (strain LMG P-21439 / DCA1) TaxID=871963 RepID=L0FAA4_DESDL|nr:2-hydroxymuconate tautomerase [Desulfitobacterium dichloroeliminans]AGA69571.1 4-oxalocrotonate tautomerase family enzyme [Desulfitobacterium dichloroeliminans LMG P-21439]
MPFVQIDLLEGRTHEQKRQMVEKVTQAIVESTGAKPESVSIIIREMARGDFATGGILATDK